MLTDKHGHELKVGDKVLIPCIIVSTNPNQENDLNLEVEDVIAPGRAKTSFVINCKQVTCGKRPDPTRGTTDEEDVQSKPKK